MSQSQQSRFFWGLFLILIGFLFLLEQAGKLNVGRVFSTYWPVIFILIGISLLITNGLKKSSPALLFIFLGIFLLLIKLHVIERYLWNYLWPALLIVLGLWILLKPHHKS